MRQFVRVMSTLFVLNVTGCDANIESNSPDGSVIKAELNEKVPEFSLPDLHGTLKNIAQFRGKIVVLEWFNPDCPFVSYAHLDGPLRDMAATQTDQVVWLGINSGGVGKQGTGIDRNKKAKIEYSISHPVLLDENGSVGRMFGAKTTPQMVLIDEEGILRYNGGLDNSPLGKESEENYQAYFENALKALLANAPIGQQVTKPYGCSVKYSN